jgi:glucan phosphoethanolaminetransferase (alkaline phosphatase superfamily)
MYWAGMKDSQIPGTLINIFCLLASISTGLFLVKLRRKEEANALQDIKDAMSAGLPYTIIVSVFIFFFYGNIDKEFTDHKISERLVAIDKAINDTGSWDQFKIEHPDYETYSKEQFYEEEKIKIETANSPRSVMIVSLLGGLMMGMLYSILVTVIYRVVVFR